MKLYSELVDERITFEQFRLVWKVAESSKCEKAGAKPHRIGTSEYNYGSKQYPVDAAKTILKVCDDPSWETVVWEHSRLQGGTAEFEAIEKVVQEMTEFEEKVPKRE